MRGILPFLRDLFFGTPEPRCRNYACKALPAPYCFGGLCPEHCSRSYACQCLKHQDQQIRAINKKENIETLDQEHGAF